MHDMRGKDEEHENHNRASGWMFMREDWVLSEKDGCHRNGSTFPSAHK